MLKGWRRWLPAREHLQKWLNNKKQVKVAPSNEKKMIEKRTKKSWAVGRLKLFARLRIMMTYLERVVATKDREEQGVSVGGRNKQPK